MQPHQYH